MRYPACEKLEIIRLVEQSHLPVRRTLAKLGILPATGDLLPMVRPLSNRRTGSPGRPIAKAGYLSEVLVRDNQPVKAGEVLAKIDARDYVVALAGARADVTAAQAEIDSLTQPSITSRR